jgi:hypothetical protein
VEGDVDTMVTEKSQTAPALARMVSGSYFSMVGTRAELGLLLALADEQAETLGPELPRPASTTTKSSTSPVTCNTSHGRLVRGLASTGATIAA